jgi:hypothetical protein
LSSYSFSKFDKIVDVGGGDGGLLVAFLEANPTLEGVVFDLPQSGAAQSRWLRRCENRPYAVGYERERH